VGCAGAHGGTALGHLISVFAAARSKVVDLPAAGDRASVMATLIARTKVRAARYVCVIEELVS
jgi:hypothetical protein